MVTRELVELRTTLSALQTRRSTPAFGARRGPDAALTSDASTLCCSLAQQGMKRRGHCPRLAHQPQHGAGASSSRARAGTAGQVHSALVPEPAPQVRASQLDAHRPKVDELMRTYPDITAQRVFEIRCATRWSFAGGYTGVKVLVRRLRLKVPPTPSLE